MKVVFDLAPALEKEGISLTQLAEKVGLTVVTISRVNNNRIKGIRLESLTKLCVALRCEPGDILRLVEDDYYIEYPPI